MHHLRQIYIFHTLIDTMKNLLNYQQLSPFDGVRVSCGERLRRCIIIVIGENLLFDLTRVFSRSLAPASWWSAALILCNCNYHFHKQCMVVVIAAVLNARAFNVSQIHYNWRRMNTNRLRHNHRCSSFHSFAVFTYCSVGAFRIRAHARISTGCVIILWVFSLFRFGVGFHSRWVYFIRRLHFLYIKLSHNLYAIHSY